MKCHELGVNATSSEPCLEENEKAQPPAVLIGLLVAIAICILITSWAVISAKKLERQNVRQMAEEQARYDKGKGLDKAAIEALPLVMFKDTQRGNNKETIIEIRPAQKIPTVRRRSSAGLIWNLVNQEPMDFVPPGLIKSVITTTTEYEMTECCEDSFSMTMDSERRQSEQCEDEEESCSICLDVFDSSDMVRMLPCSHLFHRPCVDSWFERSMYCPLCKQCPVDGTEPPPDEDETQEAHADSHADAQAETEGEAEEA